MHIVTRQSDTVVVRRSAIQGLGCFAARRFTCGERLLPLDDSRVVDAEHPLLPEEDRRHCDYLAAGRVILMQPPERNINHSCDPNVYTQTVKGIRWVIALRDIAAGEEITCDYCLNSGGDALWTCNCGAARCRKSIHSDFFHLPLERQIDYLPYLDDWFIQERRREYDELVARRPAPRPPGGATR